MLAGQGVQSQNNFLTLSELNLEAQIGLKAQSSGLAARQASMPQTGMSSQPSRRMESENSIIHLWTFMSSFSTIVRMFLKNLNL